MRPERSASYSPGVGGGGGDFGVRIFWQVASLGLKTYRTICGTKMREN